MSQAAWILALAMLLAAAGVRAESPGRENVIFAYAQVLRADPVYERVLVTEQVERCDEGRSTRARGLTRSPPQEASETLVQRGCQLVEEDREVNRLAGYDVEYRYRGDVFISRVAEDPGDRLRIRVAVSPALDSGPR
jgi:uncharacterized protein YcfJ